MEKQSMKNTKPISKNPKTKNENFQKLITVFDLEWVKQGTYK